MISCNDARMRYTVVMNLQKQFSIIFLSCMCVVLLQGRQRETTQTTTGRCYGQLASANPSNGYWVGTCDATTDLLTGETNVTIDAYPRIHDVITPSQHLLVGLQSLDGGTSVAAFQFISIQNWGWLAVTPASLDTQAKVQQLSATIQNIHKTYDVTITPTSGVITINTTPIPSQ